MTIQTIQIDVKIRKTDDRRKWEDIDEIFIVLNEGTEGNFCKSFVALAVHAGLPIKELRWNYAGSKQGHYVSNPLIRI